QKTYRTCFRSLRGEHADEIRTLVLLENQRSHIGQITSSINDGKMNLRIILRHDFHDGRLRETNPDNQVVPLLRKRAHRRFNRSGFSRLDIAQDNVESLLAATFAVWPLAGFSAAHARPGSRIKRTVILAADIKDDAYMDLGLVISCVALPVAGDPA